MKSELEEMAILRLPKVKDLTGLGKTTIYALMAQGKFPQRVILSPRTVGWRLRDIRSWLEGVQPQGI